MMKSIFKADIKRALGYILLHLILAAMIVLDDTAIGGRIISILIVALIIIRILGYIAQMKHVIIIEHDKNEIYLKSFMKNKIVKFNEIQQIYFDRDKFQRIDYVTFYNNKNGSNDKESTLGSASFGV